MPNSNSSETVKTLPPNGNKATLWYGLALVAIIIDQITKLYFENNFQLYQSVPIIEPFLSFTLAHNPGAAFSFLADKGGWQKWFFSGLALIVSLGIMVYLRKVPKIATALSTGLAMILAGALGNLIDRVRLGYVIDFIHVHNSTGWNFPIFNVADMAINLGVALILIDSFFLESKRNKTT